MIASSAPAPASGSAIAAVVAAAAALVQKVARLSTRQWPEAGEVHTRAERLRLRAEELIEEDSQAYLAFVEAMRAGVDVAGAKARTIEIPLEIVRAAAEVAALLKGTGFRASADLRNEKLGFKVREAELAKVPYMVVVGEREAAARAVSLRLLRGAKSQTMTLDGLVDLLKAEPLPS